MMGWIGTILIGFVAGLIARAIHPGDDKAGFIVTALLGIGGAAIARFVGDFSGLYGEGGFVGFIFSVVGAIIILAVYGFIKRRRAGV